ncbi:MAG: hypothetical protein KGI00_03280 [Candidatus Micrarchaeota archaeon]|nr:hypothetical protein [Candidatus Micrarchaeota archaeon]
MAIDQEKDEGWKELAKKKRDSIAEWREVMNKWLIESDPMKRASLRKQEEEVSDKVLQADKELDAYVESKGGY